MVAAKVRCCLNVKFKIILNDSEYSFRWRAIRISYYVLQNLSTDRITTCMEVTCMNSKKKTNKFYKKTRYNYKLFIILLSHILQYLFVCRKNK